MTDNVKATMFLMGFLLLIPALYLAPTLLNALTDIVLRF